MYISPHISIHFFRAWNVKLHPSTFNDLQLISIGQEMIAADAGVKRMDDAEAWEAQTLETDMR